MKGLKKYPTVYFSEPESNGVGVTPLTATANKSFSKKNAGVFDENSNNLPSVSVLYNDFMYNMLPKTKASAKITADSSANLNNKDIGGESSDSENDSATINESKEGYE